MKKIIFTAALLALAQQAFALSKCIESDGKVTYTDAPCSKSAKKTELQRVADSPAPAASPAGSAPSSADAQKLKSLQDTRREKEINAELESIEDEISANRFKMDRDLTQLREKKSRANNNLAGATWEQSISAEMQSVATVYDSKIKLAQDKARNLRDELSAIRNKK